MTLTVGTGCEAARVRHLCHRRLRRLGRDRDRVVAVGVVNAFIIAMLSIALVLVTIDGVVKIRAQLRKADKQVSERRLQRMWIYDPLLDMYDQDAE